MGMFSLPYYDVLHNRRRGRKRRSGCGKRSSWWSNELRIRSRRCARLLTLKCRGFRRAWRRPTRRSVISCNKRWRSSQLIRCGRERVRLCEQRCWIELQHLAELLDRVVAGLAPHPDNNCVDDCSRCHQVKQTRELEERAAQQARFMEKSLEEAERRAAEREKEMKEVLHQKERAEAERRKVRLLIRRHERTPPDTGSSSST